MITKQGRRNLGFDSLYERSKKEELPSVQAKKKRECKISPASFTQSQ